MFESLKKKFTGTVGKISDKFSDEEGKTPEETEEVKMDGSKIETSESSSVDKAVTESMEKPVKYDSEVEEAEETSTSAEEISKKSGFMGFLRGKKKEDQEGSTQDIEVKQPEVSQQLEVEGSLEGQVEPVPETEELEKEGILSFVTKKTISEKDIDDILFELEMSLLEGDVAMEVAEKIINSVKEDLVGRKIKRRSDVADFTREALKKAISEILDVDNKDITEMLDESRKNGEPLKLMFVGINGTGKTTTIAKVATYFIEKGYEPVIAASDTFRAGAIEQITHHADKIGVKIIKHQKGADPAAVAYDAVAHAKAKGKDMVLIDTAGRMQTNINLMDEMKKIKRVVSPELIIYVGDALTGNDAVEQARKFDEAVGVDGIILTKADADARGGAALSIGYIIQKPILFLGVGQAYEDIMEFKPEWMVDQIFGE
ncbi:signal recognition particle-docking protein FtsY [Methanobacterium paludis]|uniref:Signal recognition particle receptor FtsY n=1 Tax=Methanobacterium paludis (strain DSM 25820 / JCM 18151 / SWAN1) TaxID=868131 RepID=F6D5B1_METPW|nr:signal recognition particle-docking protein FtsY [Methanobacterium paludis]AEG18852.1 signal recognition particle-docking protein FtsY [Methanobacterium paludis]